MSNKNEPVTISSLLFQQDHPSSASHDGTNIENAHLEAAHKPSLSPQSPLNVDSLPSSPNPRSHPLTPRLGPVDVPIAPIGHTKAKKTTLGLHIPAPNYPSLHALISPFAITPRSPPPRLDCQIDKQQAPIPQPAPFLTLASGFLSFLLQHIGCAITAALAALLLLTRNLLVLFRTFQRNTELSHIVQTSYAATKKAWHTCPDPQNGPLTKWHIFKRTLQLAAIQSLTQDRFLSQPDLLQQPPPTVDRLQLQRLSRFATATYGARTMLSAPPEATSSEQSVQFHKRIYSSLCGLPDHSAVLLVSLQKHWHGALHRLQSDAPWEPQFFVVRDEQRQELVLVFRGTQSWHDVVMDITAVSETFELPSLSERPHAAFRQFKCHSGMLQACKALLQPGSSFTFNLSNILKEHPNYKLVFTGHSLGAGVAFVMAIILAGCQTDPSASQKEPTWVLHHPSFPTERGERPIQAVCFAPPNWCDPATATAVAKGHPSPLVTSVAIESDIVCRFCWPQVRLLKRTVVYLSDLPRDDLSGLLIGWLTKKLGLSSGTHLIERAWAIRKDLGHLARETEPDRWGPPGYLLHLARDDKSNASSQWQLYEVKDHQRLYGAILLLPSAFSQHVPPVYQAAVESVAEHI